MTQGVDFNLIDLNLDLNLEVNRLLGIKQYRHIKQVMKEFSDKDQQPLDRVEKVDRKIE